MVIFVYYADYVEFGKAVGFLDKNKTYSSDLDPEAGLTSYIRSLVGSTSDYDSSLFPKTIKYILDRQYDVNNISSNYPYGIFYPINEEGILQS